MLSATNGHAHPHDDDAGDHEERQGVDEPVVPFGSVDAERDEEPVEQPAAPVDDPDPDGHGGDHRHRPGEQERDLQEDAGEPPTRCIRRARRPPMVTVKKATIEAEGDGRVDDGPQPGVVTRVR